MVKKWLSYIFPCILVPAAVLLGATVFKDKQYAWISLCVAVLSCVPFFLAFEKGKSGTKEMILIAVMVALSAVGRLVFAWAPSVKPVTALDVFRSTGRLYDGCTDSRNIEFLFWAGSMDTVPDVFVGYSWAYSRSFRSAA
mgnify:CR=1 FL=1